MSAKFWPKVEERKNTREMATQTMVSGNGVTDKVNLVVVPDLNILGSKSIGCDASTLQNAKRPSDWDIRQSIDDYLVDRLAACAALTACVTLPSAASVVGVALITFFSLPPRYQ
jgi:hypothetical protein